MHLHSTSTLSSNLPKSKHIRQRFVTGLWLVLFLFLFDVSINLLFPYPSDPRVTSPGQLNLYFEYGRSIEGKLARIIGPTDESSAPIAKAGWLDPEYWKELNFPTTRAPGEDLLVSIYGMSFSNDVGEAMKKIDSRIGLRLVAGPGAPPHYSFTAYKLDRGRHKADVVILGILASSVRAMRTTSGLTWSFEAPAPYTYPRYFVENGKLKAIEPKVRSLAELRAAMQDQQKWDEFVLQMQQQDEYFNSFLFQGNWLDNSAIVRLIRRAYAQQHQNAIAAQVYSSAGFNTEIEIPVLSAIVTDFAATAQSDGKLPIVLLINDRGYEDHLYQALKPTLKSAAIPYVSTHNVAPATDIRNFVGDGHFTDSTNKLIAQSVLKLINEHFPQRDVLKPQGKLKVE
jgi:hypothetical protein